jgi:hypothetical protein
MPITTYNEFISKQEEFWIAVYESFEHSEICGFKDFFVSLFALSDHISLNDNLHPINIYGVNRATSENIDQLRTKITNDYDISNEPLPGDILRYMFEEETHPIYEALVAMIRKYKQYGNTLRTISELSDSNSDSDSD